MLKEGFFDYEEAMQRFNRTKGVLLDLKNYSNNDDIRLYIFGAGIYAGRMKRFFSENDVSVDGFVVDDNMLADCEVKDVLSFSQMCKQDDFILIYGVGGGYDDRFYNKTDSIQREVNKCKNATFYILSDYWMYDLGYMSHEVIDMEYITENIDGFQKTYDLLEDELSRKVMKEYLYASVGHDATHLAELGTAKSFDYDLDLLFSNCRPGTVIECGAFDGKSIVEMSEYTKNQYKMIALECEEDNFNKCLDRIKGYSNIKVLKLGAWNKKTKLAVVTSKDASYLKEIDGDSNEDYVEVTNIDSIVEPSLISAIVMDIEGSELEALHGAKESISKGANLAVRVYHKKDDLISIPSFIKSINDSYKFYIRFNIGANKCRMGDETTLYAICR